MGYLLDHPMKKYYKKCLTCGNTKECYMISKDELLQGRNLTYKDEYTKEISDNLDILLQKINVVRTAYGKPMKVNSGWRPAAINANTPGAAKASKHTLGLAVDIADDNKDLWSWCLQNLELLSQLNLFLEDKRWCATWVHFGVGAPLSGKRIFVPSSDRPSSPDVFDGIYDHKYDVKNS